MIVTLLQEKLDEILEECSAWEGKASASRRQLQSLAEKLQHGDKCVKPAKHFMNRVLSALK